MMFEPRSRGFSDPLLGQPFYGWYCAPLAPGFFSARSAASGCRIPVCRHQGSLQSLLKPRPCVPQLGSTIEDQPLGLR